MKTRLMAALLLVGVALPAQAQFGVWLPGLGNGGDPSYWVGLSWGYVDGVSMSDEATNSTWSFAYTSQIRATLEKTVATGITIGASAGFASSNLSYRDRAANATCTTACKGRADIAQYMAFVRGGNGKGFHPVYSLEGGVTRFTNFRDRVSGAALPPAATNDFTFGISAGLGYGFSPTSGVYVGEQFDFMLHQQSDEEATSAPRQMTFRVGFRIGF